MSNVNKLLVILDEKRRIDLIFVNFEGNPYLSTAPLAYCVH
jgi:hypothetical protein